MNSKNVSNEAEKPALNKGAVSGSYCVRKHDLFAVTYQKVAENLSKDEAESIKNEMQTKSIEECGCPVPVFFVSEV
jgi:hypothetical protein